MDTIFYNSEKKSWFDYNKRTKSLQTAFYASSAMPLYTGCYTMLDYDKSVNFMEYMNVSYPAFC